MKIEDVFADVQSYEALWTISEKVEPKISFWGSEYLVVEGYEGSLDRDSITSRVLDLVAKNHEYTEVERGYGKNIASRINYIYEKTSEILKTCSLFTQILVVLRRLSCSISYMTAWSLYDDKDVFQYYTRSQFNKTFGYPPEEAESKGIRLCELNDGIRHWRVLPNPSN